MQTRTFEQFLKKGSALTRRQRERLLGLLLPAARLHQAADLIDIAPRRGWPAPVVARGIFTSTDAPTALARGR